MLSTIVVRDQASINQSIATMKLTYKTHIEYVCVCGCPGRRMFRSMWKNGAFCKACALKKRLEKIKVTCLKVHGVSNPTQDPVVKQKMKDTNMARRGVANPTQDPVVNQKAKDTNMAMRGVEYPLQDLTVKQKMKDTNMERRGVEYSSQDPAVQQKVKDTNMKRRGVEHASQDPIVKQKKIDTNMERRGVQNPMQNAEVAERQTKSAHNTKPYTMPDGCVRMVQGYEPFALDILIHKFRPHDILTSKGDVPKIWYVDITTDRRYYSDIYIPSINTMIEVKCKYTYETS